MTHSVHFDIRIDGNPAGFIEQLADFRQALEKQGIKTTGTGDQLTDKDRFAMGVFCQVLDKALCDSTDPELVQKLKRFAELPGEFTRSPGAGAYGERPLTSRSITVLTLKRRQHERQNERTNGAENG